MLYEGAGAPGTEKFDAGKFGAAVLG